MRQATARKKGICLLMEENMLSDETLRRVGVLARR